MAKKGEIAAKDAAYTWGVVAEDIAAEYLRAKDYTICERRWQYGASKKEIDIIAQKEDVMIFVEVKARTSADTDPVEAVDRRKMRFVAFAADAYLRSLEHSFSYRFDIIGITGSEQDYRLEHIADAFLPPLLTK